MDLVEKLRAEADRLLTDSRERGGVRNCLSKSTVLGELAASGVPLSMARTVLGSAARPTKLTIFDKTPDANWSVPWHQDLTITVERRCDIPGYGPWTEKDGLPHVQPPVDVLQQTLAIRLHLDDTPLENGALRVLARTHRMGRLTAPRILELCGTMEETVCPVAAGGAMLMSPLLLHSSRRATSMGRRRVLHLEYSAALLPEGLTWSNRRLTPPVKGRDLRRPILG
jgi:ectoine hydroxylase-related dioxygenase (phytanoyl-CoA dioxygenase family)